MTVGTRTDIGHAAVSSTATSLAITTTANINAGDLVIVWGGGNANGIGPTAVVDSGGVNTYTIASVNGNSPSSIVCAYCRNASAVSSGGTITGTFGSTNARKGLTAFTVAGMRTASTPLDPGDNSTGTTTGTGTSSSTLNVTPVYAQALITWAFGDNNGVSPGTFGNLGGFTQIGGSTSTAIMIPFYLITTTYATVGIAPTWGTSVTWRLGSKTFDAADAIVGSGGGLMTLGIGS